MQFKVIALDLDGTIAFHDRVHPDTWRVLRAAKQKGFSIFLATGRRLRDITQLGPFDELCDAIVAEDGAAICFPSTDSIILPFGRVAEEVIDKLHRLEIPIEKGLAIAASWTPHDETISKVLASTGYAATIEYNKGAVMVLPPGATKGSGLNIALRELGYSLHNVIAFGDAENDRSLFEQSEISVAVSNATEKIKELADIVLTKPDGEGVRSFIKDLTDGLVPTNFKTRPAREITLGHKGEQMYKLNPLTLTMSNMGIFGASGSGKSWLSGLLAESLLKLEYQIFIIDPEGDYRSMKAFPNTLLLGGLQNPPPSCSEVSTLLEYSNMSIVLDLSQYDHEQRLRYTTEMLQTVVNLRENRGKPHWFLIDEIHYFCQNDDSPFTNLLLSAMKGGGFALVSYKPSEISTAVHHKIRHLMLTRIDHEVEIEVLRKTTTCPNVQKLGLDQLISLTEKQVYFISKQKKIESGAFQGVIEYDYTRRKVPHIRHLHKYLRAPLPLNKQFHFDLHQMNGLKLSATSIYDFLKVVPRVTTDALKFHLERGDFEAWFREVLHDEELVKRVRKISKRNIPRENIKHALTEAVGSRYRELEKLV